MGPEWIFIWAAMGCSFAAGWKARGLVAIMRVRKMKGGK